ncbi:hypothetical protein [Nocardia wallacei]|uniref:hypothetical protein n=1 Tax=Nocardia wallacei TaxID=480035 RepID=UPI002454E579|nr:hypothetical protein [Nocardia wallacei]
MQYYTVAPDDAAMNMSRACDNCRELGTAHQVNSLVDGFDIVRGAEWKCDSCGFEFRTIGTDDRIEESK